MVCAIVGRTKSMERDGPDQAGLSFVRPGEAIQHPGFDRARCDGVDAHTAPRHFDRRRLGEPFDGVLAGGVDGSAGGAGPAIGRGHVDDAAVPLRQHHPELVLHAEQRAEHVGLEGGVVALGRLLGHRPRFAFGPGVVHGRIEPTEASDGRIDQVPHVVLAADVGTQELGLSTELTELGDQPTTVVVVTTRHDDASAIPRESQRRCAPDARQGAGDQNDRGPGFGGRALAPVDVTCAGLAQSSTPTSMASTRSG